MRSSIFFICLVLICFKSFSQNDNTAAARPSNFVQPFDNISSKSLKSINEKYNKLDKIVEVQSEKLLKRMQQKEEKLQNKLQKIDSAKAKELFPQTQAKYHKLQTKLKAPVDKAGASPLT